MEELQFTVENGVGTLIMNRPDKFNAVTRDLALGMQPKLLEWSEDPTVRAIVLKGSGKAFCAGQDLNEVMDPENKLDLSKIVAEHYNPLIKQIREIEKPVIGAINGVAAGAGANIALACDITIAAESASFIQAFSKIGLIPDSGGTYTLPRLVGYQKAAALMMLGDKVSAADAEKMGMIYKMVSDDQFEAEIKTVSEKLAQMPTKGLGLTKRALNYGLNNSLEKQLDIEEQLQTAAAQTEDYHEGVSAFLEKRKPEFKGK